MSTPRPQIANVLTIGTSPRATLLPRDGWRELFSAVVESADSRFHARKPTVIPLQCQARSTGFGGKPWRCGFLRANRKALYRLLPVAKRYTLQLAACRNMTHAARRYSKGLDLVFD
jgi:hypothetical protein